MGRPKSAQMVISIPVPQQPLCADVPQTWHETTALHVGHSTLSWRFCGDDQDFVDSEPTKMLNFALQFAHHARMAREARTCVIMHARSSRRYKKKPWPLCDLNFSLPFPDGPWTCDWCESERKYELISKAAFVKADFKKPKVDSEKPK